MPSPTEDAIKRAIQAERERCAKLARSRRVQGYVADIGCYACLERVAKAIEAGVSP